MIEQSVPAGQDAMAFHQAIRGAQVKYMLAQSAGSFRGQRDDVARALHLPGIGKALRNRQRGSETSSSP
jgi:hypothetical protein